MGTPEIADLLKGPRGTKVQVKVGARGRRKAPHNEYRSR